MSDPKAQPKAAGAATSASPGPTNSPPGAKPAPPSGGRAPSGKKPIVIGVLVALLLTLVAYGVGRLQGFLALRDLQDDLTAMQIELARLDQLEARRHLHLAIRESEVANFGNAQKHVVAAARLLNASQPQEGTPLYELSAAVSQTRLVPAADFSEQRGLLVGYLTQLDKLVPPRTEAMTQRKD